MDFAYPGYKKIAPVEVPDANLMGVYAPRAMDVDEEAVLQQGFASPIGAPRLRQAVGRDDRVLILIDDASRSTPTARILPFVFDELHAAGVSDDRVEFLQLGGGSIVGFLGYTLASPGLIIAFGWCLLATSLVAWYLGGAMMLEGAFKRVILPLGKLSLAANVPGRVISKPVEYVQGQPGVRCGQ